MLSFRVCKGDTEVEREEGEETKVCREDVLLDVRSEEIKTEDDDGVELTTEGETGCFGASSTCVLPGAGVLTSKFFDSGVSAALLSAGAVSPDDVTVAGVSTGGLSAGCVFAGGGLGLVFSTTGAAHSPAQKHTCAYGLVSLCSPPTSHTYKIHTPDAFRHQTPYVLSLYLSVSLHQRQ